MVLDTLNTLADIKDYFRECFSNASINSAAKRKFIKYIEAIEEAKNSLMDGDVIRVVRCGDCSYWKPPTKEEAEDGCTIGHCWNGIGVCVGKQTDATWFCADGERVEE